MSTAIDSQLLHSPEDDTRGVPPISTSSASDSPYEPDLAPMTFKSGRRVDDFSDSSDADSDGETDGRNKPLPAPPTSSGALSSPKSNPHLLSSQPNISHIPNHSTSTVSSYTTASSISSVPVTPITPNTPVTPYLPNSSAFPSTTSLSRASSFSITQSPTVTHFHSGSGTRSRQPSIVSLAGGYHLPTMVAGKTSPTIGHKPSLPLLNDTDVDAEVDTEVDGYFFGGETIKARTRLTRQPSLGSRPGLEFRAPPGSGHSLPMGPESPPMGIMRRYASAGNLLSNSSSRPGSSNSGHQHSYSHPTPFSTAAVTPSPYNSSPSVLPESSETPAVMTSIRSREDSPTGQMGTSRSRSRAGSTVLRNAVYIEALDSSEVERRLLTLPPISDRDYSANVDSDIPVSEREEKSIEFEQSKWSPASSVVDLRSSDLKISTDSSSSSGFGWGFPKIMGAQAPPPTPSTPFSVSRSGSSIGLADASMKSPVAEDAPKRSFLSMNVTKRKSLNSASPVPPPMSQSDTNKVQTDDISVPPATPGKRQRLASFIAKMAGNVSSQVPPVPSPSSPASPPNTSPSSPSAPPSPTKLRTQYRPAPLDLSLDPKNSPAADNISTIDTSELSTPAHSTSSSFVEDSGSETETETEDDMDDMDPELLAVAAGFDIPSVPSSPRTPRPPPSSSADRPLSYERGTDFPATPTAPDDDAQMVRGSYAQVYGFRSPKKPSSPLAAQSLTYLPSTHSQVESSVPRGATPTLMGAAGTQSLIGPGDLPPSAGSLKTPRNRKVSMINTTTVNTASVLSSPRSPPSSPPRQSIKTSSKSPKSKGGRMSGLISRFTLGSSTSLAVSPRPGSPETVPPVPPLKVDELGQISSDPFAKDDCTTVVSLTATERTLSAAYSPVRSSFVSSDIMSSEINREATFTRRERSGTTGTASSAFSTSTNDSTGSSLERQSLAKKKRRSLGLTLGTVSIGTISSMRSPTIGTARGKKRKLVINGVEENDVRAVQAVRIWCESFGEVKKFERRDNGSLVVDWRSKNVNDMVCRVQANVFIKGAGSVALSWIQS